MSNNTILLEGETKKSSFIEENTIHRDITRVCIHCALLLLQYGAESTLIEQLSRRLGIALGASQVESHISANGIVLTTVMNDCCMTSTRRNEDRGINMHVVTEVQHVVILAERKLLDLELVQKRLSTIKPLRYNAWLMIFMVAVSCGCFSQLNGGSWDAFLVTFLASGCAMAVKLLLSSKHMNPFINFGISAFIATSLSGLLLKLPYFSPTATIAMAASVLLLVPGFPLINAVSDMFKGYVNTGIARWVLATLLTLATCIGIVLAISVWNLRQWA